MRTSTATAVWEGGSPDGSGTFTAGSGAFSGEYGFGTRFGEDPGTNPEELLAAAHASCFSMALAHALQQAGNVAERLETRAHCTIEPHDPGFRISRMRLQVRARVPGVETAEFQKAAEGAMENCPISAALHGNLEVELEATLES